MIVALALSAGPAAQQPQRFRSGVDLITVDVTALDARGVPVEDLRADDFTVKVDGKARRVVAADLVKVDPAPAQPVEVSPTAALISTNEMVPTARRVAFAIDQTLIVPKSLVPLLRTAGQFVDALGPNDHAALVTFPEPGPRVSFTTDKSRVRDGLSQVVGQPAGMTIRRFNAALSEAIDIQNKERTRATTLGTPEEIWKSLGPAMQGVLARRTCEGLSVEELLRPDNGETLKRCVIELGNEAMTQTLEVRQEATLSLQRLESFLTEMLPVEGSKTLILISAGLVTEDLTVLNEIVRLAAASRTTVHVIAVEPERETQTAANGVPNGDTSRALQDRQLLMTGLETVADRTGGSLLRAVGGNGEGLFRRLSTEISAWYVVAVERQPGERDAKRIDVDVRRRGVTVRANHTASAPAATSTTRGSDEVLREALGSAIAMGGVPLRLSAFARRDAAPGKIRIHLAADIGSAGASAGEYSVGYVIVDRADKVVASLGRRLTLSPVPGSTKQPLVFDTALAIDPGQYSIRFGVVDPEGRRGTAVRQLDVSSLISASGLQTSDLILGSVPADGDALHPRVEPHVSGQVAGHLELYLPDQDPGGYTAILDIAEGEHTPALASRTLNISQGAEPSWRVASGAVEAGLLPGRYMARVTVRKGSETIRVLSRPFVLEAATLPPRTTERIATASMSPELQRRTAAYVTTLVNGLANIVAQEEFTLSNPERRVTSDFLLVRYPGSNRDLLTFRDVTHVNGQAVPDHEQQLVDLFIKPFDVIRGRVRQITSAADAHVPSQLNPLFVLAFLQGDFQSRFELTVRDAGREWPPQVRAVTFVETSRPTLLRTGQFGDIDVPTRGTAWIEEATGRIVQSELEIGTGKSPPRLTTRFTLDDRLQIMVPSQMRTENPSGVATYRNFRRFRVQTDTVVAPNQR